MTSFLRARALGRAAAFATALIAIVVAAGAPPAAHTARSGAGAQFVPGELLVRFKASASQATRDAALSEQGASIKKRLPVPGLQLVAVPAAANVERVIAALNAKNSVLYAEPNWIYHATATPNDPSFGSLWGLHQASDVDIDAPEAWDVTTGSKNVVVGVVDTGIAWTHGDLAANMWANPDETLNGVDDDGNGRIDDVRGWDFVNEDNDPYDDHNHGTHVAGTIGAVGNNGLGVVGVNWNVTLMPLKFLNASGSGSTADAVDAIGYARLEGADVVNNSWGGGGFSQALLDAFTLSTDTLFLNAAGNSNNNNDVSPSYPCSYDAPNIVCVAATTSTDAKASFSSYGATTVDLGAPGVGILSTIPSGYGTFNGTSMATPHVAGVAALAWAKNPGASVATVKSALLNGGDAVASMAGITVTGRRLNAAGTLALIPSPGPPMLTVSRSGTGNGTVTSAPTGIDCGGDCSEAFASGTSVSLTATPAPGSHRAGWFGCDSVTAGVCTVQMNSAHSVTAVFTLGTFADVPTSHQFFDYIEAMFGRGITTGCGLDELGARLYCPNDDVTRQAMAAFIIRAEGLPLLTPATPSFADVPSSHQFYGHIERMLEQGITTGCGRDAQGELLYCPDHPVSRQAMAAFIIRAKGLPLLTPATPSFADVPSSHQFHGHIERMLEQGITTGCGRNAQNELLFCPEENVTRQAMAAFLIRAFSP